MLRLNDSYNSVGGTGDIEQLLDAGNACQSADVRTVL